MQYANAYFLQQRNSSCKDCSWSAPLFMVSELIQCVITYSWSFYIHGHCTRIYSHITQRENSVHVRHLKNSIDFFFYQTVNIESNDFDTEIIITCHCCHISAVIATQPSLLTFIYCCCHLQIVANTYPRFGVLTRRYIGVVAATYPPLLPLNSRCCSVPVIAAKYLILLKST